LKPREQKTLGFFHDKTVRLEKSQECRGYRGNQKWLQDFTPLLHQLISLDMMNDLAFILEKRW